jgi:hypothetical protein
MPRPKGNPEKVPSIEELKKIPKKKPPSRNSRKKCLACNNGLVYTGKGYKSCVGCGGQGFIK